MKEAKPRRRKPSKQKGCIAKKHAHGVLNKISFIRGSAKSTAVTLLADNALFTFLRVDGEILLASIVCTHPGAGRTSYVRCDKTLLRRIKAEAEAFFRLDLNLKQATERYGGDIVTEFASPLAVAFPLAERRVPWK